MRKCKRSESVSAALSCCRSSTTSAAVVFLLIVVTVILNQRHTSIVAVINSSEEWKRLPPGGFSWGVGGPFETCVWGSDFGLRTAIASLFQIPFHLDRGDVEGFPRERKRRWDSLCALNEMISFGVWVRNVIWNADSPETLLARTMDKQLSLIN